jgi:hypothetical protein
MADPSIDYVKALFNPNMMSIADGMSTMGLASKKIKSPWNLLFQDMQWKEQVFHSSF